MNTSDLLCLCCTYSCMSKWPMIFYVAYANKTTAVSQLFNCHEILQKTKWETCKEKRKAHMHTSAYLRVQRKSRSGWLHPSHPIGILAASNHLAYAVGTAKKIKKRKMHMHTHGLSDVRSALNRQALRSLYLGNGPLRLNTHSSSKHHYTSTPGAHWSLIPPRGASWGGGIRRF